SASDWVEGGWTPQETATVASWARDAGADFFDVSSGGLDPRQKIEVFPGYQVPFAVEVSTNGDVPVAAVGLITDVQQANEIVSSGKADAVLLGREHLRDPHFTLRAAAELGVDVDYWPEQYLRARHRP